MDWRWGSIITVWVLAVVGAVAVALTPAREQFWSWIPVAFGLSILAAFAIQLSTRTPEGFVHRAAVSVLGSLVVFAVATGVLALAASGVG